MLCGNNHEQFASNGSKPSNGSKSTTVVVLFSGDSDCSTESEMSTIIESHASAAPAKFSSSRATCLWRTHARTHAREWMSANPRKKNTIGPEFGIGYAMGLNGTKAPTTLLKSFIGNRALGWDLLPPGTKELEYDYGNGKVFEEQAGDGRR